MTTDELPLTVKDVSRKLNIHVNTVRRWADIGVLRSFRINARGDRRFNQSEVNTFLNKYDDFNDNKSSIKSQRCINAQIQ